MSEARAPLYEVFFSIQGEGLWVGLPQVFVRVRGCDMRCLYCDTPAAREERGEWTFDLPGVPCCLAQPNPVPADRLLARLDEWLNLPERPPAHSLALTGGEPLLYPDFVAALGRGLRSRRLPLYLETGGHHPKALAQVLDSVDFVALDCKLPSTLPQAPAPAVFAQSAALAAHLPFCVKVVVTDRVSEAELEQACRALSKAAPRAPLVLQPVTGVSPAGGPPSGRQLLAWQALAGRFLPEVRVIPQCHRLLGVR